MDLCYRLCRKACKKTDGKIKIFHTQDTPSMNGNTGRSQKSYSPF